MAEENVFLVIKPRLECAAAQAKLLKLFSPEYFYYFFFRHQYSWNHDTTGKLVLLVGKQIFAVSAVTDTLGFIM